MTGNVVGNRSRSADFVYNCQRNRHQRGEFLQQTLSWFDNAVMINNPASSSLSGSGLLQAESLLEASDAGLLSTSSSLSAGTSSASLPSAVLSVPAMSHRRLFWASALLGPIGFVCGIPGGGPKGGKREGVANPYLVKKEGRVSIGSADGADIVIPELADAERGHQGKTVHRGFTVQYLPSVNQWGVIFSAPKGLTINGRSLTSPMTIRVSDGDWVQYRGYRFDFGRQGEQGKITTTQVVAGSARSLPPPLPVKATPTVAPADDDFDLGLELDPEEDAAEDALGLIVEGLPAGSSGPETSLLVASSLGPQGVDTAILAGLRGEAIQVASGHVSRVSPTATVFHLNYTTVLMKLDARTGDPLRRDASSDGSVEIGFILLPDQNRLALTQSTKLALKQALLRETSPERKRVLATLLSANGLEIVAGSQSASRKQIAIGAVAGPVLPASDSEILEHNLSYLERSMDTLPQGAMTICFDLMAMKVRVNTVGYHVGSINFMNDGQMVGMTQARPLAENPRGGTFYPMGIQAGSQVQVVLHGNTIVWHGPLGHLNDKQMAEVLAMDEVMAAERSRILSADPYALDMVFGEGVGPFLRDMVSVLGRAATRYGEKKVEMDVLVARDSRGALHVLEDDRRRWLGDEGSYHTVGKMKLKFEPLPAGVSRDSGVGFKFIEVAGIEDALSGVSQDLKEAMEWLKTRFVLDYEPVQDNLRTTLVDPSQLVGRPAKVHLPKLPALPEASHLSGPASKEKGGRFGWLRRLLPSRKKPPE